MTCFKAVCDQNNTLMSKLWQSLVDPLFLDKFWRRQMTWSDSFRRNIVKEFGKVIKSKPHLRFHKWLRGYRTMRRVNPLRWLYRLSHLPGKPVPRWNKIKIAKTKINFVTVNKYLIFKLLSSIF